MNTPPVIDEDVEDTENEDKECGRPLRLEANCNHGAGGKTDKRHEETSNAPFTPEGKSNEEEDE